jgi:hypothetical protein
MTEMITTEHATTDLRCSVQTAELGEQPAGSAGFARRVLLVELPLPWPKKIDQHELLADLDLSSDETIKVLGIRSSEATHLDRHRVICWEATEPFRCFERTETVVDRTDLGSLLLSLVDTGPEAITTSEHTDQGVHDLLLCTHGSRDRCCGQLGTLLHLELDCAFEPNVRVWRTSHTGGHRFAPTGIHFPHGTTWSYLTAELTVAIIEQSIGTTRLGAHYRGNLGIDGRPAQVAEAAVFLDRGWTWLDSDRSVTIETTGGSVAATVTSADHQAVVTMQAVEAIPVPACGESIEVSHKSSPQFEITIHN